MRRWLLALLLAGCSSQTIVRAAPDASSEDAAVEEDASVQDAAADVLAEAAVKPVLGSKCDPNWFDTCLDFRLPDGRAEPSYCGFEPGSMFGRCTIECTHDGDGGPGSSYADPGKQAVCRAFGGECAVLPTARWICVVR